MTEQGDEASLANAANWLRLIFHSLTCNNPGCVLGERCSGGKALISHVLTCSSSGACMVPSCASVRRLILHWLRCQDTHCRLCAAVWRDLSGHYEVNQQRGFSPRTERQMEPLPPEAPGTPDRTGAVLLPSSNSIEREDDANATGDGVAAFGRRRDEHAADVRIAELGIGHNNPPAQVTDRAVIQLQEATSYMRYLLYCLMCRQARVRLRVREADEGHDTAARAPGLHFWLNMAMPPQATGHVTAAVVAAAAPPAVAVAVAAIRPPTATAALRMALPSAGRRLLCHRLMCRNPLCALCSGTCELFTRGQGLRRELPVPSGLYDMDVIVHLSPPPPPPPSKPGASVFCPLLLPALSPPCSLYRVVL
ncbi:hypothetical protein VOLCADRAFT_91513 [Volvox carteri f. nagariensis]|uniref:TAZ-type domain-containing protein n=1 Tax=Volvox carteri f. nagariensis TaxID=3068 RepID=D8TX98_VOLCA|nr:uncharacterized protein VOLCADRAFT_91513 [Volvox carteri f. nagariensis]EFJ47874.1 hypothetical protein VOLCADRAFT_91513 [Volvox carteri f. nagariensis]|eukprot:XP_002950980.1 hypothetical protein VOLCADRAFT_91513 [Volvox carteri f. nagariensis]